ncbi:MAG: OmpA family protein [Verrucomicrobiae bacterium]|nr:OmpA family protein [Verrucomicrobiae bacterium]
MPSYFTHLLTLAYIVGSAALLVSCGGGSDDDSANKALLPKLTIAYSQSGNDGVNPEVQLSGLLPSSASKKTLIDAISGSFPYPIKIVDQVEQKSNVPAPDWYPLLPAALPGLFSKASSLTIAFDNRALELTGVSDTAEQKDAVAKDSVQAFSSAIDYVNHKLRVEKVKPRPSQLSITMDESGKVSLRGLVNDNATRTSIEAVLGNETWHGSNVRISNEIEVRPYAGAPSWAAELRSFLPIYFDTPQERSLFISSDSVRLGGKVRSEQEKRSLVYAAGRAFLDSDLPVADTLVTNRLTEDQRRLVLSRQSLSDFVSRIHIYFESGHHTPTPEEKRKIQAVAAKLAITETDEKLLIVGLTDGKGDKETNDWIKNERCKAVYNTLIEMGAEPSRLVLDPKAEGTPRANETPEQSRRVEFHVFSPTPAG